MVIGNWGDMHFSGNQAFLHLFEKRKKTAILSTALLEVVDGRSVWFLAERFSAVAAFYLLPLDVLSDASQN
ncbi:hypothetical protein ACNKHN_08420 [Shigella flexneri]